MSSTIDDTERARLRVVAEECGEPKLRIALDAVASLNEDEPALVEALEQLDAEASGAASGKH